MINPALDYIPEENWRADQFVSLPDWLTSHDMDGDSPVGDYGLATDNWLEIDSDTHMDLAEWPDGWDENILTPWEQQRTKSAEAQSKRDFVNALNREQYHAEWLEALQEHREFLSFLVWAAKHTSSSSHILSLKERAQYHDDRLNKRFNPKVPFDTVAHLRQVMRREIRRCWRIEDERLARVRARTIGFVASETKEAVCQS